MTRWRSILRNPLAIALIVGHLVFLVVLIVRLLGVFEPLELMAYDRSLRFSADATPRASPVTLIGATESDLANFGWPLSDDILASLIERLSADRPAAIGIDIYRDAPVAPGTERLAAVLQRRSNVVWIFKFSAGDTPKIPPPAVPQTGRIKCPRT